MKKDKCSSCEKKNKLTMNTVRYVCNYCGEEQDVKGVVLYRIKQKE